MKRNRLEVETGWKQGKPLISSKWSLFVLVEGKTNDVSDPITEHRYGHPLVSPGKRFKSGCSICVFTIQCSPKRSKNTFINFYHLLSSFIIFYIYHYLGRNFPFGIFVGDSHVSSSCWPEAPQGGTWIFIRPKFQGHDFEPWPYINDLIITYYHILSSCFPWFPHFWSFNPQKFVHWWVNQGKAWTTSGFFITIIYKNHIFCTMWSMCIASTALSVGWSEGAMSCEDRLREEVSERVANYEAVPGKKNMEKTLRKITLRKIRWTWETKIPEKPRKSKGNHL